MKFQIHLLIIDRINWYIFDDTDVSECKMDDDEELRSQCFGGDHPSSSFDQPPMKRYIIFTIKILYSSIVFFSRQRRWWNAYILFYEKSSRSIKSGE